MIGKKTLRRNFITMFFATLFNAGKTVADFHAFYCVNAHQRMRQISIKAIKNRFTQARKHATGDDRYPCSNGTSIATQLFDQIFHFGYDGSIRAEKRVVAYFVPVKRFGLDRSYLGNISANSNAVALLKVFLGNGTGRHPHGRFPGGRTTTAAIITQTEFLLVGVVRVRKVLAMLE